MSESPSPRSKRLPPLEALVILAAMALLGAFLIPRCLSTVWSEKSWTGWDAALAGRVMAGETLYTDGLHVPIAPLAVLEMIWLGRPATWLGETAAVFGTGCASILLVYAGLRRLRLCPTSAAVAALVALPAQAAWMKMLLYDETALVFAAGSFLAAASMHRRWADNLPAPARYPLAMAACTALSLLSKYSIGLGLLAGACAFLAIAPRGGKRWRPLAAYLAALPVCLLLACLLFSPWISVRGLFSDVVATASETKGGSALMLALVACIARNLLYGLVVAGLFGLAAVGLFERPAAAEAAPSPDSPGFTPGPPPLQWPVFGAALAGGAFAFCLEFFHRNLALTSAGTALVSSLASGRRFMDILIVAGYLTALASLAVSARAWWRQPHAEDDRAEADILSGWFPLLLAPAFVMFCLSGGRWILSEPAGTAWLFRVLPTADPLDLLSFFGIAVLFSAVLGAASRRASPFWARWLAVGLAVCCGFASWSRLEDRVALARDCTDAWPEVSFLRGVRLQPASAGMRQIVSEVRRLAPSRSSRVLMLPEDPQTVALFERPRPAISGGIVFFDMYKDAFVDSDFRRLAANPPQVILIGPSGGLGWGLFMFGPHHDSRGASRLMRRVEAELLPSRYRLVGNYYVNARKPEDTMAIYQLREATVPSD